MTIALRSFYWRLTDCRSNNQKDERQD